MKTVEALKDHRNAHGEKRLKKQGDKYAVPDSAVAALTGPKLAKVVADDDGKGAAKK